MSSEKQSSPITKGNRTFFPDVAVLRSLSIMAVVAFHTTGMMYADAHFPATKELYHSVYYAFNQCLLINVAMPMFVFLSGYLFHYQLATGRVTSFVGMVRKKVLHILVPYFVFGLVMMATTANFNPISLFRGGYWHLWFLPMLFWCFVVSYALRRLTRSIYYVAILISAFGVSLCGKFLPQIMGLHYITVWYCWFIFGGVVFLFCEQISSFMRRYRLQWLFILSYVILTVLHPVPYGERTWFATLAQAGVVVALWLVFHTLRPAVMHRLHPLVWLSRYSYGIYIFHNWLAVYLISSTAQRLLPLASWAEHHVVLFPLCFFLITMLFSFACSWLLLKTRVGKFLIG